MIDQLIQQGVDYFCLSPGFRTTPLALAIASDPRIKCFVHFDERGLGFHALGYAKASGKPAAVVVTSGTAVGNLMPAVMEASASHTPMILLTCDRPAELRDTMANQTCDQVKCFGNYVRYFFDFPSPSDTLPLEFLATTIGQGVYRSHTPLRGPVHFNCPFPEPFVDEEMPSPPAPKYSLPIFTCEGEKWADECNKIRKGAIVIGADGGSAQVKNLAQKLGWPILCDILSSYRHMAEDETVCYAHHFLKSVSEFKADAILYLGNALVSKTLLQWMKNHPRVIHVTDHPNRCDPLHCVTDRITCPPALFCEQVEKHVEKRESNWAAHWQTLHMELPTFNSTLTEPGVIKVIEEIAKSKTALFFGNSMPIRDADMFFYPKHTCGPIFANRGLSGIDGNLATCAGIAQVMPVIAVVGDQTFLHDLNSLAQFKKTSYPIKLIVINNGGGGIFSFVAKNVPKEILDSHFAAKHELQFEEAARLFNIPYDNVTTVDALKEQLSSQGSCFIEVITNREENHKLHQTIEEGLCFSCSTVS